MSVIAVVMVVVMMRGVVIVVVRVMMVAVMPAVVTSMMPAVMATAMTATTSHNPTGGYRHAQDNRCDNEERTTSANRHGRFSDGCEVPARDAERIFPWPQRPPHAARAHGKSIFSSALVRRSRRGILSRRTEQLVQPR
jgi:hypothetical protein